MKNILVTGGAGFIGSHLVPALLSQSYQVRILDNLSPQIHGKERKTPVWLQNYDVNFIQGSVTSRTDIEKALQDINVIIHLAAETGTAQSMYEIARYNEVNTQGTALLLDVIANGENDIQQILLASSRAVYGEGAYQCGRCEHSQRLYPNPRSIEQFAAKKWEPVCPDCHSDLTPLLTREDDKINPASIYAATKYAQEDIVRITCEVLGIGYAVLRLQNVYGEGQSLNNPYTGILSIFSTRIKQNLELPLFEDGLETRDFVHVEDVANAFIAGLLSEVSPNQILNVGTGVKSSIEDIAISLSHAFDIEPDLVVTGQYRLGDIRHNFADISKLNQVLGYKPEIQIEQGLARFVNWVKKQPLPEDRLDKANEELKARNC